MASKDSPAPEAPTPSFGAAGPPPPRVRGGEPALDRDAADTLAAAIETDEWAGDGLAYEKPEDAHAATSGYRRALEVYGLIPEGKTLGSRVIPTDDGFVIYLTWKNKRVRRAAAAS